MQRYNNTFSYSLKSFKAQGSIAGTVVISLVVLLLCLDATAQCLRVINFVDPSVKRESSQFVSLVFSLSMVAVLTMFAW